MAFQNILGAPSRRFLDGAAPKVAKPKKVLQVGCEHCPLNAVPGINKVIGEVHGRDIFIWGMAPGATENRERQEFLGPSGELLWQELARVGIKREMCDVQNVVRCFPADRDEDTFPALKMRNPTKEEIHCCSIYTKQALERSQAKVHLVFGEIAAKALLGGDYRKGKKLFWSDKLNGHVMLMWHPSYLIRQGYRAGGYLQPNATMKQWRKDFEHAAELMGNTGRFDYIRSMQYIPVTDEETAFWAYKRIKKAARKGWRVVVDIEDGVLRSGRKAVLCVGFCYKPGLSLVFCLDHRKGVEISPEARAYNWHLVRKLLRNPHIKKALHHGSYDAHIQMKLMDVEMVGVDYDTEFGEYFADPEAKSYGLAAITDRRFPEFAGYKEITAPECITPEFMAMLGADSKLSLGKKYEMARKKGGMNLALVPWDKLVLYNGADCDVTKRVELSTRERSSDALMHMYIDASYITARMEKDGPLFDYKHHVKMMEFYSQRVPFLKAKAAKLAGDKDFKPGSPQQVKKLLFETLALEMPDTGESYREDEPLEPNTRAETLELMKGLHPVVDVILQFRRASKLLSTYLEGFKRSADLHNGKVTTKWWLTGCQPAGELVLTNRGYLPIEQVQVGDRVISHTGKSRKVKAVVLNGVKPIVKVTLSNGLELKTTGNHPYRVGEEWIAADDLDCGMKVTIHSDKEEWRTFARWPNYEISSWGRVFNKTSHKMLAQFGKGEWGHLQVGLFTNNIGTHVPVHRLVAKAFLEPSQKPKVRHMNGIAWDNTRNNLKWGTRQENVRDTILHGKAIKNRAITEEMVEWVRSRKYRHGSDTRMAKAIGCSRESVRGIRKGRSRMGEVRGKEVIFKTAKIIKIEALPSEMTYGLTVAKDASYVTGGIVTHNTGTGRMSSGASREKKEDIALSQGIVNLQNIVSDQHLQNMLISDERWRDVYAFWKTNGPFTDDNWRQFADVEVFLGFDEGQFEMRVVAQRSGDKALIRVFEQGLDIHAEVGHRLMGLPKEQLMEECAERVAVKGMHFGIVYGLKAKGLWAHLRNEYAVRGLPFRWTVQQVQELLNNYFATYSAVARMIAADHENARKLGFVETMLGFRRPINVTEQTAAGSTWKGAFWQNQASNCVDFKTEALTQRGWLKWNQIKRGDVLLTKNAESGKLEWQSATDIRVFPNYAGELYELESKSFSAVTTPKHRWLVRRDGRKGYTDLCVTSDRLSDWGDDRIHRTGDYDGPSESRYSDDWVRLVGWVVTDGSYKSGKGYASNMVRVIQSKQDRVREIGDLFLRLGIHYRKGKRKDGQHGWTISGMNGGWFKAVLPNRRLTYAFLAELPKRQLCILRDTMISGDGWQSWTKTGFCAGRKKNIDVFQALCVLCGDASTVRWRDMSMYKPTSDKMNNVPVSAGCWVANILKRKFVRLTQAHKKVVMDAKGVWCPVVPNTYFVARRRGSTYITGNTPIQGTAHQLLLLALVRIIRFKEKFKLLQRPKMEIHDAIYFAVKLKDMFAAAKIGQRMLEQDCIDAVREEFGIDWKVPFKAEPKAAFRFGVQIKNVGIAKGPKTIPEFLNAWCEKNQKTQKSLIEEMLKIGV